MKWYFFIFIILLGSGLYSQEEEPTTLRTTIIDGDTMPDVTLDEVEVLLVNYPKSKRGKRKFNKYIRNVKRVLPYAKLAGKKLHEYEDILQAAESDKERRKIMKQAEEEITSEFTDDIEDMTFSQGLILIKLIDRETGETSFNLVQELRGKFRAFFYQGFARLWGFNLKVDYDPDGEDRQLEAIVRLIEMGRI